MFNQISDDSGTQNISKLEEVLKRQRERLDNISGAFQKQGDLASSNLSDSTPLGRSEIRQSEGVYSTSTNNLEKAYEDLEREIIEIKQRLQNSVGSNVPNHRLHASLREPQTQNRYRAGNFDRDTELAQSIGSNLVGPGSASASRRHGNASFQPLRSHQRSPARSGGQYTTGGANYTNGPQDLEEGDYSLSVSDLNSNSFYKSGKMDRMGMD